MLQGELGFMNSSECGVDVIHRRHSAGKPFDLEVWIIDNALVTNMT
jgi:hypothetical protein